VGQPTDNIVRLVAKTGGRVDWVGADGEPRFGMPWIPFTLADDAARFADRVNAAVTHVAASS